MKENLIKLTEYLASEGFEISGMEVETTELVRIKFNDSEGLELVVNDSYAMIIEGKCTGERLSKLRKLVKKLYTIKDGLESFEQDMFNQLLNAS